MADIAYFDTLKRSFRDVYKNPVLFLPIIFNIVLIAVLTGIVLLELVLLLGGWPSKEGFDLMAQMPWKIAFGVVLGIIDLVVMFITLSYFGAMILGMYKDIVDYGKANLRHAFKLAGIYWKTYLMLGLFLVFWFVVPLGVLALIITAGFMLNTPLGFVLLIILGIVGLCYILAFLLFVTFGLFFSTPLIVWGKYNNIWSLVKLSWNYTRKNFVKVLLTWLMMFGVQAIMMVVSFLVVLMVLPLALVMGDAVNYVYYPLRFIVQIVSMVMGMGLGIFLFRVFKEK